MPALVTGIAVAVLYVVLRLVFIYGDTGALPDGTSLTCNTGPTASTRATSQAGQADELAPLGITDGASLEAAAWRELLIFGGGLIVLTVAGGLIGGGIRSVSKLPSSAPLPPGTPAPRPVQNSGLADRKCKSRRRIRSPRHPSVPSASTTATATKYIATKSSPLPKKTVPKNLSSRSPS